MESNGKYRQELLAALQKSARHVKLLDAFLDDLLTPTEYREIAKRWQIVRLLSRQMPQRAIAKKLGVGIATITRGSRELSDKQGGFRQLISSKK